MPYCGIDYVACVDCGHMVPLANIDMHELSACKAAKPASLRNKKMPPGRANSSVSSGSSGSSSQEDRLRREAARLAACKAQAQAVGKVEDCRAVDFTEDAYAAFHMPRSTSFNGNIYSTDKDYVAVARAAGLIEDGRSSDDSSLEELPIIAQYQNACNQAQGKDVGGVVAHDCCDAKDYATYKKKQHHAYEKHSAARPAGRIENGVVVERPYVPHVITIDDESIASGGPWTCPQCAIDNGSQRSVCAGCRFSNTDPAALEQLADLPRDASGYYKRFSAAFNVTCGIAVGSAIGGATSVFRGRSVVDGLIEGAVTGVLGGGLVAVLR